MCFASCRKEINSQRAATCVSWCGSPGLASSFSGAGRSERSVSVRVAFGPRTSPCMFFTFSWESTCLGMNRMGVTRKPFAMVFPGHSLIPLPAKFTSQIPIGSCNIPTSPLRSSGLVCLLTKPWIRSLGFEEFGSWKVGGIVAFWPFAGKVNGRSRVRSWLGEGRQSVGFQLVRFDSVWF